MDHFDYRGGVLHCEDVPLTQIAAAVGTPVYIYSSATMERHARVFRDLGKLFVEDLGSGNGTFVNGTRVDEPMLLRNGDRVKVGPVLLRYEAKHD